jgi:hypothetical protein
MIAKPGQRSFPGDSVPSPLGFFALMADPSETTFDAGLSFHRTPAWSWTRSRRSACFPAEAYPPPRPLVVHPPEQFWCKGARKKQLILAALSDMPIIGSKRHMDLTSWRCEHQR